MFYSQHVLTKKGPLAKIWLAAHMQNKLTKAMVFSTNIQNAVSSIISPDVPMALRLTSNLLLGVVRILSRKTKYLLQESSDAMTRLKLTFRPRAAEALPTNTASLPAITLPTIDALEPPNIDLELVPMRVAPPPSSAFLAADQDITIDQFAGGLMGGIIDAFALEPQLPRDAALDLDPEPLLFTPSQRQQGTPVTPSVRSEPSVERLRAAEAEQPPEAPQLSLEREREQVGERLEEQPLVLGEQPFLEEPTSPRDMSPVPAIPAREREPALELLEQPLLPESEERLALPSPPGALAAARISVGSDRLQLDEATPVAPGAEQVPPTPATPVGEPPSEAEVIPSPAVTLQVPPGSPVPPEEEEGELTTQVEGEPPSQEAPPTPRRGRKRKVYVMADEGATEISAAEFRAALNDTSDLLRQPTQRRRVGTVSATRFEELISRPTVPLAPQLMELFTANFRADELILASPISDADLGERVAQEEQVVEEEEPEKAAEKEEERGPEEERPPEKEVTADPSLGLLADVEAMVTLEEEEILPSVPAVPAPRDTISPVLPPPIPEMEEPRAASMGRESVGAPMSVSAAPEDEGQFTLRHVADTVAQVESEESVTEATVSARTRKMQEFIMSRLEDDEFDFTDALAEVGGRRTAARCFYELLNLSNKKALSLRQEEAYGRIWARPIQPTFNTLLES